MFYSRLLIPVRSECMVAIASECLERNVHAQEDLSEKNIQDNLNNILR